MEYGQGIELSLPYPEAVRSVKAALKEQGFGVLTEIDVKATMREKIDRDIEAYVILAHVMVAGPERDELAPVADEAARLLSAALSALSADNPAAAAG